MISRESKVSKDDIREAHERINDCPCDSCDKNDWCDGWDARFCCSLCEYLGGADCDSCKENDNYSKENQR